MSIQRKRYASLDEAVQEAVKRRRAELAENPEAELKWQQIQKKFQDSEVKKEAEFKADLERGHSGEHLFFQKYQHLLTHLDGRNADFEINKTGETIELKSDYYDMDKTENFFMECYSYDNKPGGAFQAADKGITYYIYYYVNNDTFYVFNTKQLVRRLAKFKSSMTMTNVKNKGYTTRGLKMARELLTNMCLDPEEIGLFETKKKVDK